MARTIALIGGDRPFGAEIVARLARDAAVVVRLAGDASLDALVINTPVTLAETRFADVTDDQFDAMLEQHVHEPAGIVQAAAPWLRRGGAIVLVASRAHLGGWGGTHQMAAGAALIGLSRSLALEFAAAGVRVNVVAPDFVGGVGDTPARRAEIADAVAFLASPASAAISGEVLLLDGGNSLRMTESARR